MGDGGFQGAVGRLVNVRYWHKADNLVAPAFVRFWTKADKIDDGTGQGRDVAFGGF